MADPVINERKRASFGQLMYDVIVDRSISANLYPDHSFNEEEGDQKRLLADYFPPKSTEVNLTDDGAATLVQQTKSKKLDDSLSAVPQKRKGVFRSIFEGVLVETYLRQGYNFTKNEATTTEGTVLTDLDGVTHVQGKVAPYNGDLNVSHMIWTILGFPTRFDKFKENADGEAAPRMSGKQIFYNMIGGWYPVRSTKNVAQTDGSVKKTKVWNSDERVFWQWVAVFTGIKALIFVFNVAATLFRFVWNTLKWGTEVIPSLLKNLTGYVLNELTTKIGEDWDSPDLSKGEKLGRITGNVVLTILLGIPHWIGRVAHLIGQAFTSPEQSIRRAFEWGYYLEITDSPRATTLFRWTLAIFAATLSVSLTAALWAVALPFAIAGFVSLVPQSLAVVNAVTNSWLIAPMMSYVYTGIATVGGYLSVFAPAVSFIAGFLGVAVTQTYLAVGVILGTLFNAIVLPIVLRLSDEFSDWWALRPTNSGPYHFLKGLGKHNHHHHHNHGPARGTEMEVVDPKKGVFLEEQRNNKDSVAKDLLSLDKEPTVVKKNAIDDDMETVDLGDGNDPLRSIKPTVKAKALVDENVVAQFAARYIFEKAREPKNKEKARNEFVGKAFAHVNELNPRQLSHFFKPSENDPTVFRGFSKASKNLGEKYLKDHAKEFQDAPLQEEQIVFK
jgi:hypothetical protein